MFLSKSDTNKCYNIISLNTGGLKTKERFDTALKFCQDSGADFSILQETHLGSNKYNEIRNQWNGEVYISPGTTFRDGIILLLKGNVPKMDILKSDTLGKFIIFRVSNTTDVIANIYAPSGGLREKQEQRQSFFREINNLLDKYTNT